jgi:hypothetical protein
MFPHLTSLRSGGRRAKSSIALGMHADHAVDDELEARETDAVVGHAWRNRKHNPDCRRSS